MTTSPTPKTKSGQKIYPKGPKIYPKGKAPADRTARPKPTPPPATKPGSVPPPSQSSQGVSPAQWSVIGLLLLVLMVEAILRPGFRSAFIGFWNRFMPTSPTIYSPKFSNTADTTKQDTKQQPNQQTSKPEIRIYKL